MEDIHRRNGAVLAMLDPSVPMDAVLILQLLSYSIAHPAATQWQHWLYDVSVQNDVSPSTDSDFDYLAIDP